MLYHPYNEYMNWTLKLQMVIMTKIMIKIMIKITIIYKYQKYSF